MFKSYLLWVAQFVEHLVTPQLQLGQYSTFAHQVFLVLIHQALEEAHPVQSKLQNKVKVTMVLKFTVLYKIFHQLESNF